MSMLAIVVGVSHVSIPYVFWKDPVMAGYRGGCQSCSVFHRCSGRSEMSIAVSVCVCEGGQSCYYSIVVLEDPDMSTSIIVVSDNHVSIPSVSWKTQKCLH
ncbi:hypothetical protein CEXT_206181 [Caerostris extrusa]|uniref:Uncharacterized protein n=1 Tax=Caerostris extrusa TaxID=172846 RepID=A0AAV4P1C5_CAEEX|nr:hypothetical protein CEXT_206181 [Caerostris extrusa]